MPLHLSLPVAVSGASCMLAAYVALSLSGFFGLSRWGQHRTFVFIALTGSAFCLFDSLTTLVLPQPAHMLLGRLHMLSAALHVALWLRYCGAELGPVRFQRALERVPIAAGLLAVVPVLANTGRVQVLPAPWLGIEFRTVEMTPFGAGMLLVLVLGLGLVVARYLRAARKGKPYALLHLIALCALLVCAANDALSAGGLLRTPHFADAGLCVCICVIGLALTQRWASDIRSLDELSSSLERKVAARTSQLESAQAALSRADRLAAVGRLAGGMAHEINNPGAALIANVEYLLDAGVRKGEMPPDLKETLEESLIAARRISSTVRQLLLMGRAATGDSGDATFNLAFVLRQAAQVVERRHGKRVPIVRRVPENVAGRGRGLLLEQVLIHLLSNAVQSIPAESENGQVLVEAECEDGVLVLRVVDNGVGMDEAVCERLFEPFFTTRPAGEGAGLGLAVSLGLLQALGGEVRVESEPGRGTTMTLVLEATTDEGAQAKPAAPDSGAEGTRAA